MADLAKIKQQPKKGDHLYDMMNSVEKAVKPSGPIGEVGGYATNRMNH